MPVEGRGLSWRRTQEATIEREIGDKPDNSRVVFRSCRQRHMQSLWRLREFSPRAGCGKSACPVRWAGCGNGSMAGIVRHRQLKGSATDRSHLNHRATPRLYKLFRARSLQLGSHHCMAQLAGKTPSQGRTHYLGAGARYAWRWSMR